MLSLITIGMKQLYRVDHPVVSKFVKPLPKRSRSEGALYLKFEKELAGIDSLSRVTLNICCVMALFVIS